MKKHLCMYFLVSLVILTFASTTKADTIMFPYVNENPGNVSTIISVINGANCIGGKGGTCTGGSFGSLVGALHYRYVTKATPVLTNGGSDFLDTCSEYDFCRPTSLNDIVTFDASGQLESGNAMFGDSGTGGSSYAASFKDILTPPRRGYLLVSHASSYCFDITDKAELDGEAVLVDLVNGVAFSYKAVQNSTKGINSYNGNYSFKTSDDRLMEAGYSFYENTVIWPPDLALQRYFVTPLFINSNLTGLNDDMSMVSTAYQKRTRIGLKGWGPSAQTLGVFDRNENFSSGGQSVHVRCVAAIDLQDLVGATLTNWLSQHGGGWATVDLEDPVPLAAEGETVINGGSYDAFVYDIKFGTWLTEFGAGYPDNLIYDFKIIRTKDPTTATRKGLYFNQFPGYLIRQLIR